MAVPAEQALTKNSALQYLCARHRIALLSDYNRLHLKDERIREVTNLGLSYNLLTAYTSFVAVDTQVWLRDGKAVTIKQPLPLFNRCYRKSQENRQGLNAKVQFKMVINSPGRVIEVRSDKEVGMDPVFERCMIRELKKLSFPAPERGETVGVTTVFLLK